MHLSRKSRVRAAVGLNVHKLSLAVAIVALLRTQMNVDSIQKLPNLIEIKYMLNYTSSTQNRMYPLFSL